MTASATGGGRPRGIMITGGAPVLVDVITRANDGTESNLALDLVNATAFADGLLAQASGGGTVEAIFLNTATSEVVLENVTTRATGSTSFASGPRSVNSDVTVEGYRTTVDAPAGFTAGVWCDGANRRLQILDAVIGVNSTSSGSSSARDLRNLVR